jgi:argininosuccinate lyase
MLHKIGIITASELKKILHALDSISFTKVSISTSDEDCHTFIENFLVRKIGAAGKKIHTGRSRNDQVLTAFRLYKMAHLKSIQKSAISLSKLFLAKAKKYKNLPMPGYSHTQQAMLTGVGHWLVSFAESLADDATFLSSIATHLNQNPLGSAAGFGVSIPLDRAFTAKELGFRKIQKNSLYCQSSRGKFESLYLEGLLQIMLTLAKFAGDMILFTSRELAFFDLPDFLVTGSSIMPQKRNLDVMEILRANLSVCISHQLTVKNIAKVFPSGYNRDFQLLKEPVIETTRIVSDSIAVVELFLKNLRPNEKNLRAKIMPDIFMADEANDLVLKKGIPFRDAYRLAAKNHSKTPDLQKNLKSKISPGAPGNCL